MGRIVGLGAETAHKTYTEEQVSTIISDSVKEKEEQIKTLEDANEKLTKTIANQEEQIKTLEDANEKLTKTIANQEEQTGEDNTPVNKDQTKTGKSKKEE